MSNRTIALTDALYDYLLDNSLRESALLAELREETATAAATAEVVSMQISPEQGQFMALLARLMGARRCLEIGVFTGYSALCVADVLPPAPEGLLVACDVSEEWTAVGRRYWERAGVSDRIDLRLAPATDTLAALAGEGGKPFDFAFIDAHKPEYPDYYEGALRLLRPGGLVAIDNTLWSGRPADPAETDEDTEAIRRFNRQLKDDERVDLSLVPIGDGLTLARKREA